MCGGGDLKIRQLLRIEKSKPEPCMTAHEIVYFSALMSKLKRHYEHTWAELRTAIDGLWLFYSTGKCSKVQAREFNDWLMNLKWDDRYIQAGTLSELEDVSPGLYADWICYYGYVDTNRTLARSGQPKTSVL